MDLTQEVYQDPTQLDLCLESFSNATLDGPSFSEPGKSRRKAPPLEILRSDGLVTTEKEALETLGLTHKTGPDGLRWDDLQGMRVALSHAQASRVQT